MRAIQSSILIAVLLLSAIASADVQGKRLPKSPCVIQAGTH